MPKYRLIRDHLLEMSEMLKDVAERPRREAELLMMAAFDIDELYIMTHQNEYLERDTTQLYAWTIRRSENEPMEYITNRVSFYSQVFHIEAGALIPRPETELLIDEVLENVSKDEALSIVEVGVGSGIISIILAQALPLAKIIAVDISADALAVARKNIEKFGLSERIELRQSSLLDGVDETIDILVSNPPYIALDAPLESNLDYEPDLALFGGSVGDEIIKELLDLQDKRNIPLFVCEMGYDQKEKVLNYMDNIAYLTLDFYKDLAGFDRGFVLRYS